MNEKEAEIFFKENLGSLVRFYPSIDQRPQAGWWCEVVSECYALWETEFPGSEIGIGNNVLSCEEVVMFLGYKPFHSGWRVWFLHPNEGVLRTYITSDELSPKTFSRVT